MLDITIGYALIYPQQLSYIGVDDVYIQDNYYYKGFGDTLLDALDGVCQPRPSNPAFKLIHCSLSDCFRTKGQQRHHRPGKSLSMAAPSGSYQSSKARLTR